VPVDLFKKNVGMMIDDIHDTPAAPGFDRVLIPGEKEYLTRLQYEREGIPIPSEILKDLQTSAHELGLSFPFSVE
jgi:ureidoglycolate dehydrogenase (NAD+)